MKTVALCIFVLLLASKKSTFAVVYTLQTNNANDIMEWPRLTYDGSMINLCRGILQFEFKTFLKTAVVLYQDDGDESDFFAINLKDGRLHVMATFGKSENLHTNYTTPKASYNDFAWHRVGIHLNCPSPCVQISIDENVVYVKQRWKICNLTGDLQIGGFARLRLSGSNSSSRRSYESSYIFYSVPR